MVEDNRVRLLFAMELLSQTIRTEIHQETYIWVWVTAFFHLCLVPDA